MSAWAWTNTKRDALECARERQSATGREHFAVFEVGSRLWLVTEDRPQPHREAYTATGRRLRQHPRETER